MSEYVVRRRVAGKDFEITLREDGLDWQWEARLAGEDEVFASGTVENQERVVRAEQVIRWHLRKLIAADAEDERAPGSDSAGPQAKSNAGRMGKSAKTEGALPTDENEKPRMVVTRPGEDRSLEAYKTWILSIKAALTGGEPVEDGSVSEEKWKESHREFWQKRDAAKEEGE
jgi:hypothetical protein